MDGGTRTALEQASRFVCAAEQKLAAVDADPPVGWPLSTGAERAEARDALRRLHAYPPDGPSLVTADTPVELYDLAAAVAQMIEPSTLPRGMLWTLVLALDAAADALATAARVRITAPAAG